MILLGDSVLWPYTVYMLNQNTALVSVSLASLATDPAFAGCTVVPSSRVDAEGRPTGMSVTFANGMVLSVQWHDGAYSSVGRGHGGEPTFETAAWYPEEGPDSEGCTGWFDPLTQSPHVSDYEVGSCDSVQAYQSVADVMAMARLVAKQPTRLLLN
jgi:hypothetical protein